MFKVCVAIAFILMAPSCWSCPWLIVGGTLKHVTTSANYVWGTNADDNIYKCAQPCTGGWSQVPGGLMQVDANDYEVWGVNSVHAIYKRPVDGSGSTWTRVSGGLKHVSASGTGYIWGVNSADDIYKCKKPCSGSWTRVDGKLSQIDGGVDRVYGVNSAGNIYTRPVDGSGSWQQIPGSLKHITAGHKMIFGVNSTNTFFSCVAPCLDGNWQVVLTGGGVMDQCDASYDHLFALDTNGAIYRNMDSED